MNKYYVPNSTLFAWVKSLLPIFYPYGIYLQIDEQKLQLKTIDNK